MSNAFHRPDQLSPAVRGAVLEAAARLGYSGPDPVARSLRSGRAGALGVVYNDRLSHAFDDPAFVLFLRGVARTAEEAGLGLLLIPGDPHVRTTPRSGQKRRSALGLAAVDGLVVYSMPDDDPLYIAATARGLPLVSVDAPHDGRHDFVGVDDEGVARAAAEHLLGLGHRRLAIIALEFTARRRFGPAGLQAQAATTSLLTRSRLAGYRAAVTAAGLRWDAISVIETTANTEEQGRNAARLVLNTDNPPTALLAMSDRLALGALLAADDLGVDVPSDVSIVGVDDIPAAATARPPLTTVAQDHQHKGHHAGRLLIAALGDPSDAEGRRDSTARRTTVLLPIRLSVRESTGPPREPASRR